MPHRSPLSDRRYRLALLAAGALGCGGRTGLDDPAGLVFGGAGGSAGGSPPDVQTCPGGPRDLNNDATDCGRCGRSCFGGACRAGRCRPLMLADRQVCIEQIAVDQGFVYWTDGCAMGHVRRVPKAGGEPVDLTPAGCAAGPLAIDADAAYYGTACGQLWSAPKTGPPPVELSAGAQPTSIALDASRVYWTTSGGGGAVRARDKQGVTTETLLEGQDAPSGLVADGGRLYWVNLGKGELWTVTATGHDPLLLATQLPGAAGSLAVDADSVYVATGAQAGGACRNGALLSVPRAGGPPVSLVADLACCPSQLAADEANVYFTCNGNDAMNVACITGQKVGRVMRVPKRGGALSTLVSGITCSHAIAVDGRRVYFGASYPDVMGDDRLMLVAK